MGVGLDASPSCRLPGLTFVRQNRQNAADLPTICMLAFFLQ